MTIKDCIDIVDNLKPNQYSVKEKVMWLSFIEKIIINEVLKTHEGYDGRYDLFEEYSEDKLSVKLIVPSPYDRLYTAYLKMKIDEENGETARYNNSMVMFNTYMMEYRKHYNKTHMPINAIGKKVAEAVKKVSVGLSDAEYENLKKELTHILTEYFSNTVSEDKMYDIVMKYVQNNAQMLKGKDGKDGENGKNGYTPIKGIDYKDGEKGLKGDKGDTPQKGVDYFTEEDIENIQKPLRDEIKALYKLLAKSLVKTVSISLLASAWVTESEKRHSQVVDIAGVTQYSKVDLQPTPEQLTIFHEKDVTFVTENDGGTVTVYCIGQMPVNDYEMQATITEVETDE